MNKIIDYTLLKEDYAAEMTNKIKELIKKGWELYGNPITMSHPVGEGYEDRYYQSMVLREKEENILGVQTGKRMALYQQEGTDDYMVAIPEFKPAMGWKFIAHFIHPNL